MLWAPTNDCANDFVMIGLVSKTMPAWPSRRTSSLFCVVRFVALIVFTTIDNTFVRCEGSGKLLGEPGSTQSKVLIQSVVLNVPIFGSNFCDVLCSWRVFAVTPSARPEENEWPLRLRHTSRFRARQP